ncbi:MAG: hypothetical protein Q7R47_00435, partial [Candidatus Diapherotrites archaeon]|nr:hypothetical protein [Candidatus Diapherotrites archaeon]
MPTTGRIPPKVEWILIIVLVVALLVVSFLRFSESPNPINDSPRLPVRDQNTNLRPPAPDLNTRPASEKSIPAGSIAIFYRANLSEVSSRLPVSVTDTSGGGYVTNIRWDTSSSGIVRYIPSVDRLDVMATTTSYSYSTSSISPITVNGRFFTATRRTTSTSLVELDPKNATTKSTTVFDATNFAIVGGKVYYRDRIVDDFYGNRSGGGALMVQDLGTVTGTTLLPYSDPDNKGDFFTAGNALVSVVTDYDTKTASIRAHDLSTGKVAEELFSDVSAGDFFPGSDGLYRSVKNGDTYTVSRYKPDGTSKDLIEIELEAGETGFYLDEADGSLLIVSYGADWKVKKVSLYDGTAETERTIAVSSIGSSSAQGYSFVF